MLNILYQILVLTYQPLTLYRQAPPTWQAPSQAPRNTAADDILANPIPAGQNATVSFQVLVGDTVPTPNPVLNSAATAFTYTVNPAVPDGASGTGGSNVVSTQINNATIITTKTADKAYANVGDVITYTIALENIGNVVANNVILTDAIPAGSTFVPGSLTGATGTPPPPDSERSDCGRHHSHNDLSG